MTDMTKVGYALMDRFDKMLAQHLEDYQDEMVVISLMKYYDHLAKDLIAQEAFYDDIGFAIERVLEDYMVHADFVWWKNNRRGGPISLEDLV